MHRISEIIGKPIVSAATGDHLGRVSDALLEGGVNVAGLVVGGGVFSGEHVLPFRDVLTLGGDTILARTQQALPNATEWKRADRTATRSSELRGRPVVTAAGHRVGAVRDLLLNDETGGLAAVEVADSRFGGLRTKRSILRPLGHIRIGPDAVVIPDDTTGDPGEPDDLPAA